MSNMQMTEDDLEAMFKGMIINKTGSRDFILKMYETIERFDTCSDAIQKRAESAYGFTEFLTRTDALAKKKQMTSNLSKQRRRHKDVIRKFIANLRAFYNPPLTPWVKEKRRHEDEEPYVQPNKKRRNKQCRVIKDVVEDVVPEEDDIFEDAEDIAAVEDVLEDLVVEDIVAVEDVLEGVVAEEVNVVERYTENLVVNLPPFCQDKVTEIKLMIKVVKTLNEKPFKLSKRSADKIASLILSELTYYHSHN